MWKVVRTGCGYVLQQFNSKHSLLTSVCTQRKQPQQQLNQFWSFQSGTRYFSTSKNQRKHLSMPAEKPIVVFVLGGPGAGKGTQCSKIVDRFNFVHLSAGDLLREERSREGSQFGVLIEDCIRNGKIVPVEITCSLLENAMKASGKNKFLIDGFPRNQDNLDGWNRQMADKVDMKFVLFFNCAEDICVDRCLTRGQCGSGRTDDNIESLKKRIKTYNNDSLPIIKYFENLGQVKQIDGSLKIEDVFQKVQELFKSSGL